MGKIPWNKSTAKPKPPPKLCVCGCGLITNPGRDFISGHNARCLSKKTLAKRKASQRLRRSKPEENLKTAISIKKLWGDPKHRKLHTDGIKRGKNTLKAKKKTSRSMKKLWQDVEFKNKQMRKFFAGKKAKPNKPETSLLDILNELFPNEWKYVGDGQVIINGKCPDFINVNGQKKIIELFGDYWHRGQDPKDRADIFAPFGYKTLVIWQSELKNIMCVKDKIIMFHNLPCSKRRNYEQ